jgi:hypothetical protein
VSSHRVTVTGEGHLHRVLAAGGRAAGEEVPAAVYEAANEILAESARQVPVEFGTLRASGHVTPPVSTANGMEVGISYGGAAHEYALIVHEDLEAHHRAPTKAKYLEDPVNQHAARVAQDIANAVERRLGMQL